MPIHSAHLHFLFTEVIVTGKHYCFSLCIFKYLQLQREIDNHNISYTFTLKCFTVSISCCSTLHCTVKCHTDIINFACMTWNFVCISASLSALCTNFNQHWHCISCKILPHFDVRTVSVAQKL